MSSLYLVPWIMMDDGRQQTGPFDPSLLHLLALAGRALGEGRLWFLLKSAQDRCLVLIDEHGGRESVSGVGEMEELSSSRLSELVESRGVVLVEQVPVWVQERTRGILLLVGEKQWELADEDRIHLDCLSRQVAIVLERNRLAERLEHALAAEKAAKEALAEIRGDLRLVTGQVLEVLCKTDLSGKIWLINPAAERALGYPSGALIGRNMFDLIHPEERVRAEEAFREVDATGRFDMEIRCRHRDGHDIFLWCSGTALRDDNLMPNGYTVAGRNISRRKKAEADLRRLETRFELVWEHSLDAMRLADENGRVVLVNDAYCRLVRKTREELLGEPFVVAYGYREPEKTLEIFCDRFVRRVIPPRLKLPVRLWDGSRRVFDLSSSFIEVEDQTLLLTIYRDITQREKEEAELKRLNDALRQRASHLGALTLKLTRVEQEERRRLAQILHDHLQQLLVAARMTMERVRRRFPDGEDAETAAEVEHLLDESIEASRSITVELSPPVLHDSGLIGALEWLVRRMREKQGLNVSLTADAEAEPPSVALRLFLFQAVRELLINCCKHARVPDATLSVRRIEGLRVEIVVTDEGVGFDLAEVRYGAGSPQDCFGLFSLDERMDHIGGDMRITTAPGEGTRVALVVPLEPDLAEPAVGEAQLGSYSAGSEAGEEKRRIEGVVTLLLVDDHKIMRQGLRELFREEPDMKVIGEAENGLEGIRLAQELQPDVVVMDITMPIMNGIEATRVLTAELPEIKVIGLSMHVKEDMANAMIEAGACAYVTKATASDTLVETIRDCFRKETARQGKARS